MIKKKSFLESKIIIFCFNMFIELIGVIINYKFGMGDYVDFVCFYISILSKGYYIFVSICKEMIFLWSNYL